MTDPTPQEPLAVGSDLDVERRSVPAWWLAPLGVLAVILLAWWMRHPAGLEPGDSVDGPTRVGQEVYVGLHAPEGRTLHVRSVEVHWHGKPHGASWDAYVCHGGAVGFTFDPDPFCRSLKPAEGQTIDTDTDQLVIALAATEPQTLEVDEVELSFREGIQWGAGRIGPKVTVTVSE